MRKIDYNKVVDLLELGRHRIETRWGQGAFTKDGRYCAIGAVRYNTGTDGITRYGAQCLLRKVVPGSNQIEDYNDNVENNEPIIKMYNDAIALAQEQCSGKPLPPVAVEVEETQEIAA